MEQREKKQKKGDFLLAFFRLYRYNIAVIIFYHKGMGILKRKNGISATTAYSLLQIVCWGFFAVTLVFASNVLYDYGFTDSYISIFLGLCTALSFGIQILVAEMVNASEKVKVWMVLLLLGLAMLGGNLLILIPGVPRWAGVLSYGMACCILLMLPSFVNAVGMDAIRRGSPTNYSVARGLGSLGYSVLAYFTGSLVRLHGTRMVAVVGGATAFFMVVGTIWFHMTGEKDLEELPRETEKPLQKNHGFLKQYPLFAVFLVGSVIIQYAHNLPSNFMYQIMLTRNGGAQEQGLASAICALSELPVMFFFPILMRYLRCDKWVRFSAMFMILKAVGILMASTPNGIYVAQATQALGYGLFVISSVNYAELVVGRGESVRAQTYLGSTATVGCLLATSTGGFLCEHLSVNAMVFTSLIASLVGGLLILFTAEKTKQP